MVAKNLILERTIKPLADRFINMSNALARSAQGLTLSEKRVVSMALAKTDSIPAKDAALAQFRNGWTVHLTAEEYAKEFGISDDVAYVQLKDAADKRNSERLAELLKKYMKKGQYIVISHNDEIIANSTNLYGISMHEGISKVVSLKI